MVAMVTAAAVISYAIYAVNSPLIGSRMLATGPPVLYGIFRYLYLVHQKGQGGNPTRALLIDRPLLITVALWAGTVVLLLYGVRSG
jgi:hypothetical protein